MKYIFYFFLAVMSMTSCDVEDPILDERIPAFYPVQSKTVGRVLDQNGTPIMDAVVELNGMITSTNSLGLFKYGKMELNGAGTQLIVRKQGFFNAFRTFIPNIPTISTVTIYMIDRPISGSFQHNTGGTIGLPNGASVTIPPNAIVTASGAPYTGEVVVSAYWLDPADVQALSQMPGDLRGYSFDNNQVQLASYGMMVVELEAPTGEPLNLGNGLNATLTFPVDPSLLGLAPSVIPVWSFNETTGYWEEEGTADIVGTNYVVEVSHFSWWNCDAPFPVVDFEACITSPQGNAVSGAQVAITLASGNISSQALTRYAYSNSDGKVFGKVPSGESLQLEVVSFANVQGCEFPGITQSIGPFSEFTSMTIPLQQAPDSKVINIKGNFVNCDGMPVTDGVVVTSINDSAFPINTDGTVDFTLVSCVDAIEIYVYDFEALKQSSVSNYETSNAITDIELEDFSICDDLDEFISIQYLSLEALFPMPDFTPDGIRCLDVFSNVISSDINQTGIGLQWYTNELGLQKANFCFNNSNILEFIEGELEIDISKYDSFIEGTYSGEVTRFVGPDPIPEMIPVTGAFRVSN